MSEHIEVPAEDLETLRKFDTPTVCNVIELFGIVPNSAGYMDQRIQACFPKLPPMVGYASTAIFSSQAPHNDPEAHQGMDLVLESFESLPGPPVMVYQDIDQPAASATFGDIMCSVYKHFGAQGLITSGCGRDLDQVEAIDFPVFTNGTICAHGYCYHLAVNRNVYVGGITVSPGDLLHGDRNGVTAIPLEIASTVASLLDDFVAAEAVILDAVKAGCNREGFKKSRLESKKMITAIVERAKASLK